MVSETSGTILMVNPLQKPGQSVCAYGLTSWTFIVNYTHKRPLCGHCAPPLHERTNQSAPSGLDFLDFHGKLSGHMFSRHAKRHALLHTRFLRQFHQGGTLYICPHALQKPSQSVCAFSLTSWSFMVKLPFCAIATPAARSSPFRALPPPHA